MNNRGQWGAAIAKWIRLRLPSCGPGFESQAHHTHFYNQVLCNICHGIEKKDEMKQKRPGLVHIKNNRAHLNINSTLRLGTPKIER